MSFPRKLNTPSFHLAMLKSPLSAHITRHGMTVANQLVFVSGKPFEPHRAARMEFARADPQLCAKAITETVGEARRSVVVDARCIDSLHKMCRPVDILGNDRFCVTRAVAIDMLDSIVLAVDYLYRDD